MPDLVVSGLAALFIACGIIIGFKLKNCCNKPKLPPGIRYPPGPTPIPILGNAMAVDVSAPWLTYKKWCSQYGDVVYSRLFSQDNIVINSEQIARDLLETRSQNYSDRPEIVTNKLLGADHNTALMRYNGRWRLQRKMLHRAFCQDATPTFRPMQATKTGELLLNLLEDPLEYMKHCEVHSCSTIMSAVYAYDTARHDDPLVALVREASDTVQAELRPEISAIFSAFPFLLQLPSWFPGMRLKRIAPLAKRLSQNMIEKPFAHTERGLETGSARPCMVADNLLEIYENASDSAWQKKALKDSAATAYGAGTETTPGVLANFILAMVLNPDIQEKAHDLIERVVGTKRLPTFEDRASLAYIDAIYRECLRWRPIVPLVVHASIESDVYNGYYIPKGATVAPNIWAMSQDEKKYPKPDVFNPDRFLNPDGTLTDDTVSFVWGFGRRICPGRYFAEASLWLAMASLPAVFKFSKAKDGTGGDIDFAPKWHGGLTMQLMHFPCSITPRNAEMNIQELQDLTRTFV